MSGMFYIVTISDDITKQAYRRTFSVLRHAMEYAQAARGNGWAVDLEIDPVFDREDYR